MRIGYARVSTTAQNLDMQIEALNKVGCEKIYTEKESGVKRGQYSKSCCPSSDRVTRWWYISWTGLVVPSESCWPWSMTSERRASA